ncbi:hypothetical protein VKT23_015067 [Stygiomarasmius scandens]|uniref:Uncharacterized protein n=1 Tax=Marasmiellus scandens TaxID=2682957 RepID=A0ABR1IYF7_9AGAR
MLSLNLLTRLDNNLIYTASQCDAETNSLLEMNGIRAYKTSRQSQGFFLSSLLAPALSMKLAKFFLALSVATIGVFAVEPCVDPEDITLPLSRVPAPGAVWVVGERENVTWFGCSSLPRGRITLGDQDGASFNKLVLVPDFDMFEHPDMAEVTVPDVPDGGDYFIAIWGDEGDANFNARFSIVHSSETLDSA